MMSTLIQSRIAAVRRKHALVRAGISVCTMAIVIACVLMIETGLDWLFDLPFALRAVALAMHGAALLYLLGYSVIWRLIKGPDDETVALWIESYFPEAASRVISAVQFARVDVAASGASAMMVGQVVREAEAFIEPRDTGEAVSTDHLLKRLGIALLLIVVGVALFIWGRPNSGDLLLRSLAVPGVQVPRKTRVELLTADPLVIAKGDAVAIAARAAGVIPREGTLKLRYAGGAAADYTMKPGEKDAATFAVSIDNAQDGFTYYVELNDGRSREASVEAHDRPTVASLAIEQIYPAYTRLRPAKMSNSDLTVLAGSRLAVRVTASQPLKNTRAGDAAFNRVTLAGANVSCELRPDPADPKTLIAYDDNRPGILLPANATGLAIHLVDALGLESKDDAAHPLQVIPDAPPAVKITQPSVAEELVTDKARPTIGFDIVDDFGLASAAIKYRPAVSMLAATGDGVTATYYNGNNLEGSPVLQHTEPAVAMVYDRGRMPGVPADHFSARFAGKLIAPVTGDYELFFHSDDGLRVWIDGQQVIDQWGPFSGDVRAPGLHFEAGKPIDLRVEYMQLEGGAECRMLWVAPETHHREPVPSRYFFTSDEAIAAARARLTKSIPLSLGAAAGVASDTASPVQNPPDQNAVVPNLRGRYAWDLSPLRLSPGDALEWWIEAIDANDQTGPGVTQSEHHILHVGTESEVREALLGKLGDYFQQIQDVQDGQKEITSKLGQVILEKPEK